MVMKLWLQKSFCLQIFITTSPNGNIFGMTFMKKLRWLKLDKNGHQGSQDIFQPKLHKAL